VGEALRHVLALGDPTAPVRLVVPTPTGRPFTQATAQGWSSEPRLVFACGRYEGIDARVPAWARGP
jgi:tRNA (guanine37-N1)-methyltransferase